MAGRGQQVRLGPWPAGLVLRDIDAARDQLPTDRLAGLVNLDVTDSGVLLPRRGCRRCGSSAMYTAVSGSGLFSILGTWESLGSRYAVVAAHNGGVPGTSTFYYSSKPYSTVSGDWPLTATTSTATGEYAVVVQYGGKLYFVPRPAATGGPGAATGMSRTSLSTGGFTSVATMPSGDRAFVVRERAFVVDFAANRVYWSKATDPAVWASPDGGSVDVNPGDGQDISAAVVVNSQIYIFKKSRTYLFTFTADPALDGQMTLLNDALGALDAMPQDNGVLVVNDAGVYRLLNNYFSRLDTSVDATGYFDLRRAYPLDVFLSLENDVLVVGATGNETTCLALNLRTGAWSARTYPDQFVQPGSKSITALNPSPAIGSTRLYGDQTRVLAATRLSPEADRPEHVLDLDNSSQVVSPAYSLVTGEYDYGDFWAHKRLEWAAARMRAGLVAGDASFSVKQWLGPDLTTPAQTVTVPSLVADGAKVPLARRAFRSLALGLSKPATVVSPTTTSADTAVDLWVRGMDLHISREGGSVRA